MTISANSGFSFGHIGNELINLYSDENPILSVGDKCFFLFTNIIDYHRPIIGEGIIINDKFKDGLNKLYFIELIDIYELPIIINRFVYNKQFIMHPKTIIFHEKLNLKQNLFPVEAFFIRDSIEKIKTLRTEYINLIKTDLLNSLKDIDSII